MMIRPLLRRQGCRMLRAIPSTRLLHASLRPLEQPTPLDGTMHDASSGADEAAMAQLLTQHMQAAPGQTPESAFNDDDTFVDDIARGDTKYMALLEMERKDQQALEAWERSRHIKRTTARLGSEKLPTYNPMDSIRNPAAPHEVTLEMLLAAQAHLGHATSLWHPANGRYIFGIRHGLHIIDLSLTLAHLRRACTVVQSVAERGGLILFVGSRQRQDRIVVSAAARAGGYHVFHKWTPGTITNRITILGNLDLKVVDEFDRDVPGFDEQLRYSGPVKPHLVVCLNPQENYTLLRECAINRIPTIGILDTDTNPSWMTYSIPANDDSLRSVGVIAGALSRAAENGQKMRQQAAAKGVVQYPGGKAIGLTMPMQSDSQNANEEASDSLEAADEPLVSLPLEQEAPASSKVEEDEFALRGAEEAFVSQLAEEEALQLRHAEEQALASEQGREDR